MTRACVIGAGLCRAGARHPAAKLGRGNRVDRSARSCRRPVGTARTIGFPLRFRTVGDQPTGLGWPICGNLSGSDIDSDVTWLPVDPMRRFSWPDGSQFDMAGGEAGRGRSARARSPASRPTMPPVTRISCAGQIMQRAMAGCPGWPMPRAILPVWRAPRRCWCAIRPGARPMASSPAIVKNEHLREAIAVSALAEGANPMTASAFHALQHRQELTTGRFWPKGGMAKLAAAHGQAFRPSWAGAWCCTIRCCISTRWATGPARSNASAAGASASMPSPAAPMPSTPIATCWPANPRGARSGARPAPPPHLPPAGSPSISGFTAAGPASRMTACCFRCASSR